jgi:deazaflavin-dependent oxidoreductase (nitroreductase family)
MASTKFGGCLSQPRCGALASGATPVSSFDGMFRDSREEVVAPGIPGQLNRMLRVRRGLRPRQAKSAPTRVHSQGSVRTCPAARKDRCVKHYDDYLRWLYRDGRPNRFARLQNRASAAMFAAGIWPKRVAALEVRGRRSGRAISFPVVIADYEGERYLVSMLGEDANWVRNVRAADGRAVLRHGSREAVRLQEISREYRPEILRRYLEVAPGARPHFPVDRHAPLEDFERIAPRMPVFRITNVSTASSPRV